MNKEHYDEAVEYSNAMKSWLNGNGDKPSGANLSHANLYGANLYGAALRGANLRDADLSGATGLLSPSEWLASQIDNGALERLPDGSLIAYKTFAKVYTPPGTWTLEPGSIISEVCNHSMTSTCASGINVATKNWIKRECASNEVVYKIRIDPMWLCGVVVPYNTDGKFRCERAEIVEALPDFWNED